MTSFSAINISTAGVILMVLAAVHGHHGEDHGEGHGLEIHGHEQRSRGRTTQTLGGSASGGGNKFSLDGLRSGDYNRGHVEYERRILIDGTRSVNGHAGMSADNMGNKAQNFGLGYQDRKNTVSWDRTVSGPVRTDSVTAERNFFSSPDGKGTIDAYIQHDRNNLGHRQTEGGVVGRVDFRR